MARRHSKDTPIFAIVLACIMGIGILVMVIALISSTGRPERRAREVLTECAGWARYAVTQYIPAGQYEQAVQTAERIEGHFPLGSELAFDHPFAKEYAARKESYVQQIINALQQATGMSLGHDWDAWRRFIGAQRAGQLPNTGQSQ
jgi:hypothetical protein